MHNHDKMNAKLATPSGTVKIILTDGELKSKYKSVKLIKVIELVISKTQ